MKQLKVHNWMKFLHRTKDGKSVSDINKYAFSTNIYNIVKSLKEENIITTERVGRESRVYLTEKGKKLKEHVDQVFFILR